MDHQPPDHLEQAIMRARVRGDVKAQGALARELAMSYQEEATQHSFMSISRGYLLAQAEYYLKISADCFFRIGDVVQTHLSIGLKGAVEYDGGDFRIGINRMRGAIATVKRQEDVVAELDLIIQFMMRARPESWLSLGRARWLTRKDGPQADRRWEVVTAAIGSDIYDWAKERRQRMQAA